MARMQCEKIKFLSFIKYLSRVLMADKYVVQSDMSLWWRHTPLGSIWGRILAFINEIFSVPIFPFLARGISIKVQFVTVWDTHDLNIPNIE